MGQTRRGGKPAGRQLRGAVLAGLCAAALLVSATPLAAQDAGPAEVPATADIRAFAEIAAGFAADPATATARAAALLAAHDSPALRLALAETALAAGAAAAARDWLTGLADHFDAADGDRSRALGLLIEAHLSLGDGPAALAAALARYAALLDRLGPESDRLAEELDAIETLAEALGLPVPDLVAEERLRLLVRPRRIGADDDPQAVTVWYGTNRARTPGTDPAALYGSDRGALEVGRLTVTIPPGHQAGVIERPAAWAWTGRLDPDRHMVLAEVTPLAREVFAEAVAGPEDRLLFVHGYNVSFEKGALRAAQLAFDLEFRGLPMYFSWPSKGTVLGYLADANGVIPARPAVAEFLELATRGEGRLHLIAHSMGNRYALEGLETFLRDHPDRRLGQLILTAADIDAGELATRFPVLQARADGVTLYASANDRALAVSRSVNGRARAGDLAGVPQGLEGLDIIDASALEADLLGHSYFGDAPQALADVLGLVRLGWAADERCGTAPAEAVPWRLRPDACRVEPLRAWSDLVALHGPDAPAEARTRAAAPGPEGPAFWRDVMALFDAPQPAR